MELNGARSNPRLQLELRQLGAIHERLLGKTALAPRKPRPGPPAVPRVLATVTRVLEQADTAIKVAEIHRAAEQLAGEPLCGSSVKATLAEHAAGTDARFRRVRHGYYEIANAAAYSPVRRRSSAPERPRSDRRAP